MRNLNKMIVASAAIFAFAASAGEVTVTKELQAAMKDIAVHSKVVMVDGSGATPNTFHEDSDPTTLQIVMLAKPSDGAAQVSSDGEVITDADWESYQGRHRVRIDGRWIVVEPWAVVDTPHIDGRTVVWPYRKDGIVIIRCFMPRTMI